VWPPGTNNIITREDHMKEMGSIVTWSDLE
jgi:hypothetical protein